MGHNRYPQDRKGNKTENCTDQAKNQAKSADVTGLVTGNVTAHVTHIVAASTAAAEAENATKQPETGCGIASQDGVACADPVAADPATKIRAGVGEDYAVHGKPAQPASAPATGHAQSSLASGSEVLAATTDRDTIRQTETDSVSGGVSRKIKKKIRRKRPPLPANLTRDGDAYVFQRRVPHSESNSASQNDFTKKRSSNILRLRLGPMTPPEAKKRARYMNALFDILVASMDTQAHADPFEAVATTLRLFRDSIADTAAPFDPATAIYATQIRDIVLATRARTADAPGDLVARHAGAITANAFERMRRFSGLMDTLKQDPSLLDNLNLARAQPIAVESGMNDTGFLHEPMPADPRTASSDTGAASRCDVVNSSATAARAHNESDAALSHRDGQAPRDAGGNTELRDSVPGTVPAVAATEGVNQDLSPAPYPPSDSRCEAASAPRVPFDASCHVQPNTHAGAPALPDSRRQHTPIEETPIEETAVERVSPATTPIPTPFLKTSVPPKTPDLPATNPELKAATDLNAGTAHDKSVVPASALVASYDSRYAFGGFGFASAPVSASNWHWPQTPEPHHLPAPAAGPTFSELADSYEERHRQRGATEKLLSKARLARATFIALMGDRPITVYRPRDLQFYIDRMQYWPKNHIKRSPELRGVPLKDWPIAQIIENNRDFKDEGISRKTLEDSYVAFVRAIIRDRRTELGFADPFHDMKIAWPLSSASPRKRLPIAMTTLNKVFASGVEIGFLEEAILPLMAYLTGRRIGLLLHLRGEDFRQREGVWIAHPQSHIRFEGKRIRVPYKTEASLRAFVLHNVLDEIGFSLWASEQKGPIFGNVLRYPDPSKLTSKRLNRLLQRAGAIGENIEVLHSLRHQAIDRMRNAKLDDKSRYLQAGHRGAWTEHDDYGAENLSGENLHAVANMPIDKELDLTPFQKLDFDRMAKAVRTMGRRPG